MCVCIYMYMIVHTYICMYVCMYVYMCMYVYVCMYMYVCMCIYIYINKYKCMYVWVYVCMYVCMCLCMYVRTYEGVLISPYPDQEGNKLQRPNSGFIQHTPHKAQYTYYPAALTFANHWKKMQVVRPTRSSRQQWPPRRTKYGDLPIVFFSPGNRW